MKEKLVTFFNPQKEKLFGILTFPEKKKKVPGVILVHGFSKTKSERKFVELARSLAKEGILAFRFDFSGCGDSEGNFEEMSIMKEVEELKSAYYRLIKIKGVEKNRIGIFAHSLGTLVASLFQQKYSKAKCFVLAAPAFNQAILIKRWYSKTQLKRWEKIGYLDTPKFRIGLNYLKEAKDYRELLTKIKIPTLILHGKKDKDIPVKMAKEAFEKLKIKEKKIFILQKADHHFESFFSRKKLIILSLNWFKKYL